MSGGPAQTTLKLLRIRAPQYLGLQVFGAEGVVRGKYRIP